MKSNLVLLIEDDRDIQENLRALLEMEGYQVHSAFNGKDALHFLSGSNSLHAILLDLMMPVMDGYEFLEKLTSNEFHAYAETPVILLSASTDLVQTANKHGLKFVKKPIDIDRLLGELSG